MEGEGEGSVSGDCKVCQFLVRVSRTHGTIAHGPVLARNSLLQLLPGEPGHCASLVCWTADMVSTSNCGFRRDLLFLVLFLFFHLPQRRDDCEFKYCHFDDPAFVIRSSRVSQRTGMLRQEIWGRKYEQVDEKDEFGICVGIWKGEEKATSRNQGQRFQEKK